MKKLPWAKFYPGDWLSDEQLSMCCPAARGIWIDWCSYMMKANTGKIVGTVEVLARLGRCTVDQAKAALEELRVTCSADVTGDVTGVVTVLSRRLHRSEKEREALRKRVSRFRSNASVTPAVTPAVTASSRGDSRVQRLEAREWNGIESPAAGDNFPKGFPKNEAAARLLAANAKCTADFAAEVWLKAVETNFCDLSGKPVRSFARYLAGCEQARARAQAAKAARISADKRNAKNRTSDKPNPRNAGLAGDAAKRNAAIVAAAKKRAFGQ